MSDNRRQEDRFWPAQDDAVTLEYGSPLGLRSVAGRVINMSGSGVGVACEEILPVRTPVTLSFKDARGQITTMNGLIQWVAQARPGEKAHTLGIHIR